MRASLIFLAACHLSAQGVPPDGASGSDTPGGSDTLSIDGASCFGTGLFHACPMINGPLTLTGTLETDTDPRCQIVVQQNGPEVCVVAGTDVAVQTLRAAGARPLVIIASGQLTISELLDVSSGVSDPPGAGANDPECLMNGTGTDSTAGAGGGAGGSFGAVGGKSGHGGAGTLGGDMAAAVIPTAVRGGCPGGNGGKGTGIAGKGGESGGAVYLIAGGHIDLAATSRIVASGAGGDGGGLASGGGGGGGSGGFVGLDAPTIVAGSSITIAANGGAGGEGGDSGHAGRDGADGTFSSAAAIGGTGNTATGGDGGAGSGGLSIRGGDAGNGATAGGGGGGGGGAGIVWTTTALSVGTISPPAQVH